MENDAAVAILWLGHSITGCPCRAMKTVEGEPATTTGGLFDTSTLGVNVSYKPPVVVVYFPNTVFTTPMDDPSTLGPTGVLKLLPPPHLTQCELPGGEDPNDRWAPPPKWATKYQDEWVFRSVKDAAQVWSISPFHLLSTTVMLTFVSTEPLCSSILQDST